MILGINNDIKVNVFLDGNKMEKPQVVPLGITIDDKLSFKTHTENICRKAKYKLHALQPKQRIRKYLSTDKANTLCNAFNKQLLLLCAIIVKMQNICSLIG